MNYTAVFDSLSTKSIMVIGDVMLDSYIWGNVDRISPEAPVPIVRTAHTEHRLGGAANVAKNLAALGLQPLLCSVVGDDDAGKILRSILESRKISTNLCIIDSNRTTTVKTRIISGNHQMLRLDTEQTDYLSNSLENKLFAAIEQCVQNETISGIILQVFNKGILSF